MAEAARAARASFGQISSGAAEMGEGVSRGSLDLRHSLGLVDNVIRGAHAQAMADLVRMYAQSAVVMTALPIAATVAGFALIGGIVYEVAQKIHEAKAAQEQLANSFTEAGTAANNAFRGMDDRILEAQKRSDELRNDHLGALKIQLELIDHQSMSELVKSLEVVSKAADEVFKNLTGHWYTFGQGSAGAQHALQQFKIQYDNLLSQGKDKEAGDLLAGTLSSAEKVLKLQQAVNSNKAGGGLLGATEGDANARYDAQIKLRALGVGYTEKEVQAQQELVNTLSAQVTMEGKIADLKKLDSDNATRATGNEASAQASQAARQAAESQQRMGQSAIAADRATEDARLEIQRASIQERLASDLDFAARERDLQLATNQAEVAALDKSGRDYTNQLAELNEKRLEIVQQYATQETALTSKAAVEQAQQDLENYQAGQREKIDATRQGSAERLAAIDSAILAEEALNLQDTQFYRELLQQRVETTRREAEEEAKLKEEAAKEAAEDQQKMGELAIAAAREHETLMDSVRRVSIQAQAQQQIDAANAEYALKMTAFAQQLAGLDKYGKDYETKLKAIQDREKELTQEHENEITAIKEKAEVQQQQDFDRTMSEWETKAAQGLFSILAGQRSFTSEMTTLANSLTNNLIAAAVEQLNGVDSVKLGNAKKAASNVFAEVSGWPVVGPFLAPELAAGAFAAVMAFSEGTDRVPGVTRGDTVPAMLTPGEGVVPGGVMDGLRKVATSGGFENQGGPSVTLHYRPTFHVQAIDQSGVQTMLDKHTDEFDKHFRKTVRRYNR